MNAKIKISNTTADFYLANCCQQILIKTNLIKIMKKNSLTAIFSILIAMHLSAQVNEPSARKFGFRIGANYSHINFAKGVPPPVTPINTTWGAGLNIGFFMMVPIGGDLSFQPEYAYSQMGGEIKSDNTVFKLNYFSLPLFLKYQVVEKVALLAGPQFDILINAKKTVNGTATNITHDTEERSIGITGGVEFQITDAFAVSARYMQGFNHIGIGQRSDVQEFKFEMMQLTAAIKF